MIVARQFIAWKPSNRDPSRRERCDPNPGLIRRPDRSTPVGPNHTVPSGTVPVIAQIPGNKLPGYDHLVPPGQSPTSPVGNCVICDGHPYHCAMNTSLSLLS